MKSLILIAVMIVLMLDIDAVACGYDFINPVIVNCNGCK